VAGGKDGPLELSATLPESLAGKRLGRQSRTGEELTGLWIDVDELLHVLPTDLSELAKRLMCDCVAQVAQDLGTPRTSLYTLVRLIRQSFEKAGLRAYLEKSPSPCGDCG
jgi:hypothetical protein